MEVLLTGATGHVGGRLLPELERRGHRVRALSRNPDRLEARGATTAVRGDVRDRESLLPALDGVDVAYYLVHSLDASTFADDDRAAAETFAEAAAEAGAGRIVYLGGLGAEGDELSEHLASRQEVGAILRGGAVPALELRASILIGAGSLSFELVRSVVESLPVVPLPDWTKNESQPIATDDVVEYLAHAAELPLDGTRVYEVGGADRLAYLDLLETYAELRGLQRTFVPLPVLVPSALLSPTRAPGEWLAGLAPERARAASVLIDSLRFSTVADDEAALRDFPVRPRGVREAIEAALAA